MTSTRTHVPRFADRSTLYPHVASSCCSCASCVDLDGTRTSSRPDCGAAISSALFLDSLEASEEPEQDAERLYALFHLAAYSGMRRSELAGLAWADVDLERRRVHIRQAQVDDTLDSTKSADSDRQLVIDEGTAAVLRAWRKAQLAERLAWGSAWTDSGRVFTREDGTPLRPGWISVRFGALAKRRGLPPVRFHDLRHGTASMLLAAGQPAKVISEMLGHATVAFTMDVYTEVAEELADAAAAALATFIPRRAFQARTVERRASEPLDS